MDRTLLGAAGLMVAAMALIPVGDAAGKALTAGHGAAPAFVAFARFAVGAAMVAAILGLRVDWRLYRDWRVWLRAGLIAAAIACIQTALRTEPLGAAFAAFFVGPIVSFALSVRLLGERATALQVACLALGFAGVLLIVRPGAGVSPGLLWALAGGALYGAFLTASRWIGGVAPPRQLMLSQTLLGTVLLAPLGLPAAGTLPPLDAAVVLLLAVSGVASASGNLLLILAYRRADASVLAPLVYVQLASATLVGWAAFGEWPDGMTAAGMAVIVVAGLGALAARRGPSPVRPGDGA